MSANFRVDLSGQSVQFRFQNLSFAGIREIVEADVSQDIAARAAKSANGSDFADIATVRTNLAVVGTAALAASGGAALVGTLRPETSAVSVPLQNVVGETFNSLTAWGATPTGSYQVGETEKIQKAFDEAPIGSTLVVPRGGFFFVDDTIRMTRQINVRFEGDGYITGVFNDPTKDLFSVEIEEGLVNAGDVRRTRIENANLQVALGAEARHTVHIKNASPMAGNLQMLWINNFISALSDQDGVAVHIEGVSTQAHTFLHNHIVNGVHLDGAADGCSFTRNIVSGDKLAFLVEMAPGAFKTEVAHNLLVARDGALWVKGASQLDFIGNQIEQHGTNGNAHSASVILDAANYSLRGVNIDLNNFGGGTTGGASPVDYSIYMLTSGGRTIDGTRIGRNTWGQTDTGTDIKIADSGVRYTMIEADQELRGERGSAGFSTYPAYAANTDNLRDLLIIDDSGLGTSHVKKGSVSLGGASSTLMLNSWTCVSTMRFWKDRQLLRFEGYAIAPASTQTDVVIGTLPAGFCPNQQLGFTLAADVAGSAATARAIVNTNGTVQLSCAASAVVYLTGIQFEAKRDGYDPGY